MAGLVIAIAVAAFTGYWAMRLHAWLAAQWFLVALWRWFSGHTWNGTAITDAGWVRHGTKALTPTGHAVRWHFWPRWRRAAWRTGCTSGAITLLWAWIEDRRMTERALGAVLLAAAAAGAWYCRSRFLDRKHRRTWLYPLHKVLAPVVRHPLASRAESWIEVSPDRSSVRLALPSGFPADDKDRSRVVSITSSKLALEAPEVRWMLSGPDPHVILSKSQPPPKRVDLADVMEAVESAKPTELVVGLGKKGAVIKKSLSGDAPHIGLSMGSGAGKSTVAAFFIMQWLHKGGIVLVLDAKWLSHTWLIGMPNVGYARTAEELHDAMCWLSTELDRRNKVALASVIESGGISGTVHANVGPRLLVVAEELNVAMGRLKTYWAEVRDPKTDPKTSPALTGYAELSYAGRQVKMHGLNIGQMLTAKATGQQDSSVRESMGLIGISRASKRTWDMLAPQHSMPLMPTAPGRILLVTARAVQEVQVPFIDLENHPEIPREYALSGIVTPVPFNMPGKQEVTGVPAISPPWDEGPDQQFVTVTDPSPLPPASSGVSLRQAHEAGVVGPTLAAVRIARNRDSKPNSANPFPQPVSYDGLTYLYDPVQLGLWQKARKS